MQSPLRSLTQQEQSWIREILNGNPEWTSFDPSSIRILAESVVGNSRTMKLYTENPSRRDQRGTKGYIGRVEIRTADNFGITVTVDQHDGLPDELYVDFLDLEERGDRLPPAEWEELAHIYTRM
jgi:hypothetical protein